MTKSRLSLVQILQKEFKNPVIRKKCRDSSQKFLASDDSGMSTRAFNDFPRLLPSDEFNDLTTEFAELFKEINLIDCTGNAYLLVEKADMKAITVWGRDIARRGCAALLDEQGHLQWELMELLGWETQPHCYNAKHIANIVSSYVATIIEQIMSLLSESITRQPLIYTAVCKYINEQYHVWAMRAIKNQKENVCRTQAIGFANWLFARQENFCPEDLLVLQRMLKAEFMWDTDSILMRNEKLIFWIEIIFQAAINKKNELFLAMWEMFANIFDPKQDANLLEVYQLKQYHVCQSHVGQLEKQQKQPQDIRKSEYLEQKADLSQLMMNELRERVALRNKNYLAHQDQQLTSTSFLLKKLNESDVENNYSREIERPAIIEQKQVAESKLDVKDQHDVEEKPDESADDAVPTLFGYTVGLLTAGAMGLYSFAKASLIQSEEEPPPAPADDNRPPNTRATIELI